ELPDVVNTPAGDKRVAPAAGNAPIPTEPPAWSRDRAAPPSAAAPPATSKSPFPPASSKPNPWAGDPPPTTATPTSEPRTEPREPGHLPASPFPPGASNNTAGTGPLANNAPAAPITADDGSGRPGGKHLEGSQSPQLTVEKLAPREIQVGKPAVFEVKV